MAALITAPVWLPGCGDYDHEMVPNNHNVPEVVITAEMMDEMQEQDAEREESYRQLAAEKGLHVPPPATESGPVGVGMQKRREALEKRRPVRTD
jgi:hypothetical protein